MAPYHKYVKDNSFFFVGLYIPENPIGKEVIPDAQGCIDLVAQYFKIQEVVDYHSRVEDNEHILILASK